MNFFDNILNKNGLPDVIQIERHPYNICNDMIDVAYKHGIYLQAYSPLCRMQFNKRDMDIFEKIGDRYNKSSIQTILRWQLDTGAIPIVKSSKAEHMMSNRDICDFKLTEDDIKLINSMDKEYKFFPFSWGCPRGGVFEEKDIVHYFSNINCISGKYEHYNCCFCDYCIYFEYLFFKKI